MIGRETRSSVSVLTGQCRHRSIAGAWVQGRGRASDWSKASATASPISSGLVGLSWSMGDENRWYGWKSFTAMRVGSCLVTRRSGVQIPEAAPIEMC